MSIPRPIRPEQHPRMADDDTWDALPATLRSADLQRILQIGQTTVSLWFAKGTIPGYRISHSWIAFRSEVREWLESTSTVPVPPHEPYPHPLDAYPDHLTHRDLMELFQKSRPAVLGWLRDGVIPAMRPGGRWLIEKAAVRRLLEETSNQRADFVPKGARAAS
ncbi:DNA-binding protein [Clavibacter michiganensis subsp. michiganensis]|nr:DNA-binding protein [Clavibacter michiganensis subsp. michiganensis]MWJ86561.1 DNA-binding protein [Clavibacter michiganensis subsp. michiganensis]